MAKVYEFLANGFEEIEGLAPVDILRRGGVDIKTVSVTGTEWVETSHGITIKADLKFEDIQSFEDADMLLLPGGMQANRCHLRCPYGSGKHRYPGWQEGNLLSWIRAVFQRQHRIYRYPLPGGWQRDNRRRSCSYPPIRLQDIELLRRRWHH